MSIIISQKNGKAIRLEQTSFNQEIDLQNYIEEHPADSGQIDH